MKNAIKTKILEFEYFIIKIFKSQVNKEINNKSFVAILI